MLHDVKRLLSRLLGKRPGAHRPLPPPPRFEEDAPFLHLREPADAATAWRAGRREAAWRVLTDHFIARQPVLGFIAPDAVPALIADAAARFPAWRGRLLDKVREDRTLGLTVYDRRAAPLSGGFDWSRGPDDPLQDRLYQARPHRLAFLPRWALACHYDRTLIGELDAVLGGWMAAARLPGGHPGFKSSHVVVYQLVALILAWPFLAALEDGDAAEALDSLRRRVLLCLYETSRFMRAVDGSGVANNHLLAERLADWLSAALLPEFDHTLDRGAAEAVWLAELHRQTYDDGGCFEHSVHYQEHGCELAVIYLLLARRNGWPVPQRTRERIERMLGFQLAMAGPALLPLALGNTTEDPLLPMGVGEGWQCGLLRDVQRACFAPDAPAADDRDPSREAAFWLLGGKLAADGGAAAPEPAFQDFPQSGFCVLADPDSGARVVFRLGPTPALPSIGGHSHNDLLSLCLSAGATRLLAAPGTFAYRFKPHPDWAGHPNLRAHFAGAGCRSGLFIEGLEPYGPLKGDFRNWTLPCQVAARRASAASAGLSWVEGRVTGEGAYVGQRRGIIHVWGRCWLVYDRPPPLPQDGHAAIGWQFAPGVACSPDAAGPGTAEAEAGEVRLRLATCGLAEASVAVGQAEPFRGWVSPSYGRLEPAANLRFALPPGARSAATLLTLEGGDERLEPVLDDEAAIGFRITSAEAESLVLCAAGEPSRPLGWADVGFFGALLWLSRTKGELRLRALGLKRLTAPSWGLAIEAKEPASFELVLADGEARWPRGAPAGVELDLRHDGG